MPSNLIHLSTERRRCTLLWQIIRCRRVRRQADCNLLLINSSVSFLISIIEWNASDNGMAWLVLFRAMVYGDCWCGGNYQGPVRCRYMLRKMSTSNSPLERPRLQIFIETEIKGSGLMCNWLKSHFSTVRWAPADKHKLINCCVITTRPTEPRA